MKKDDSIYLNHILDCLKNVLSYTEEIDQAGFLKNKLIQDASIRNIEIIGEAAKNLSLDYRNGHSEIDWKGMAGMRDKLIHQYMGVDLISVWGVIEEVLPNLNVEILKLLDEF